MTIYRDDERERIAKKVVDAYNRAIRASGTYATPKEEKAVAPVKETKSKRAEFDNKAGIKALPGAVRNRLSKFIFDEIPKVKFFKPDGKPKKEWKMFYGDTWDAARDAARDAAGGAAWGAARDAAWDAARGAARVAAWGAARDAARGAARDAAWDAAWGAARVTATDAARGAAEDASWDAALIARFKVVDDLNFKDKAKHLAHAKARWEVWQKGYGLLCDVDGVLYVYAKKPKA